MLCVQKTFTVQVQCRTYPTAVLMLALDSKRKEKNIQYYSTTSWNPNLFLMYNSLFNILIFLSFEVFQHDRLKMTD